MDYEAALISKVLRDDALGKVLDCRVKDELFVAHPKAWEYVIRTYTDHGGMPPVEMVEQKFPQYVYEDHKETPVTYLVDELKKRHLHNVLTAGLSQQATLLKAKDPKAALTILRETLMQADEDLRSSHDVNLVEDPKDRIARYDEAAMSDGGITGISTPWPCLDAVTQGFHSEDLIMIAGRGGVGKTWMAMVCAGHNWATGRIPLVFSREMAVWQVSRRLDAIIARLPYRRFKAGELSSEEKARWFAALEKMKGANPFWLTGDDGDGHLGVAAIAAKIHRYKPHIVYIDGAYLIQDDRKGKQRWEQFSNVCQDLKRLAQREKIPIVVTHQFNAAGKGQDGNEDTLKFGDVQMWFDLIIGCYQDPDMAKHLEMLFKINKQREGEKLEWVSEWDLDRMFFESKTAPGVAGSDADETGFKFEPSADTSVPF